MTESERLTRIIENSKVMERCGCHYNDVEKHINELTDYLLSNGVIVLPCKVGDKVYQYDNGGRIYESQIIWFYYDKDYRRIVYDCDSGLAFSEEAIGKSVFLSREEAEKVLKEREENA